VGYSQEDRGVVVVSILSMSGEAQTRIPVNAISFEIREKKKKQDSTESRKKKGICARTL